MRPPMACAGRLASLLALLVLLGGCATGRDEDVQNIGFWGVGWHFRAVQNRIDPAFPPVVRHLRPVKPEVRPDEPPTSLAKALREALFGDRDMQRRLERRLIGVFTVTGYGCAADGIPVHDRGAPVAGLVVLDIGVVEGEPSRWATCEPLVLPDERVAALRRLILDALDRAGVPH